MKLADYASLRQIVYPHQTYDRLDGAGDDRLTAGPHITHGLRPVKAA